MSVIRLYSTALFLTNICETQYYYYYYYYSNSPLFRSTKL